MTKRSNSEPRRSAVARRGAVALIVIFSIVILFGIAAFAIDLSHTFAVRAALQNASDASALAGARRLDGTAAGLTAAVAQAQSFAQKNASDSYATQLAASDIQFGHFAAPNTFSVLGNAALAADQANALRVLTRRDASTTGGPVHNFFGALLGRDSTDVLASAVAVGGGPVQECSFPMAVADCSAQQDQHQNCGMCFKMANANQDTAAWTTFDRSVAISPRNIAGLMVRACSNLLTGTVSAAQRNCSGTCQQTRVGQEVPLNGGNMFNTGGSNSNGGGNGQGSNKGGTSNGNGQPDTSLDNPCEVLRRILLRNGSTPSYFSAIVPVVGSADASCGSTKLSGNHQSISGYATIDIIGVGCGNSPQSPPVVATDHPRQSELAGLNCSQPSGDFVIGLMHCGATSGQPAGGGFVGMMSRHVRLIR